jgi:hypothetical protein
VQVLKGEVTVLATRAAPVEALNRAAEEARLKSVLESPPPAGSTIEARAEYAEKLQVTKARAKLAS